MRFTQYWFDASAKDNFERFLSKFKGQNSLLFLEIGPFEGRSTVWLLDNILTAQDCKIVCIDTFGGSAEHKDMGIDLSNLYETFTNNVQKFGDKIVTIVGESQDILTRDFISDYRFDFIYIDGSHRSPDVIQDTILSFRLLKNGGIMIFDDYGGGPFNDDVESAKLSIDSFLSIFRKEIKLLHKGYQVIIEKR